MTYSGGHTMARANSSKPPSYRLHKASGQAVVTIDRKDHYLGVHGTPDSRLRYERLISAWMQGKPAPEPEPEASNDFTIAELCAQYNRWATGYYVKSGEPTSELKNVRRAIKGLCDVYPSLAAKEFSPLKLKLVRQRFIDDGLSRLTCNRYTGIVIRIFAFGVENELIPSAVKRGDEYHAILDSLRQVKSLAKGRSDAYETDPVLPVEQERIDATLPYLDQQNRAMIKIQLLLACRPGELVAMRPREIDRSQSIWIYRPATHKSQHRGKDRLIPIGPRAQLLLRPWLPEDPDQLVFRSDDGKAFGVGLLDKRIRRACGKAGIEPWSLNQLRHAGATRIRQQASLDAAQVILGHSSVNTTQLYAEKNIDAALRIAAEVG
jgi:integrase